MIQFENVWKTYSKELFEKKHVALQGLSFSLTEGAILGLIGANGAGKSTSIRLLMDFIRPDRGSITVFDQQPHAHLVRKRIGYLPETASFPANLTILDLIRFTGASCCISKAILKARTKDLLHELDLWEARKRALRSYSKGMQQRANFVLALINDPELLILDEPMSGLDPMGRNKIISLIKQLKQDGKTILFCSHILEDVDRLVDEILILHKGKKVYSGTPANLTSEEKKKNMADAFVSIVSKEVEHV